ncbi:MAG TPA: protein TolQ [Gammaproteobacteria bacterium]|nr:protein TolQ [Gammaproteobacteria bacterium]|tara:strand:+ start:264 stop:941 length:678 start_codon:yes stop_codon:yes gene_type:complete
MLQADLTIASLILGASLLVKLVMLVLLIASLASWTLIFTKRRELRLAKAQALEFESKFRAAGDLTALYNRVSSQRKSTDGLEKVFKAGFEEYAQLHNRESIDASIVLNGTQRAMRIAMNGQLEELEAGLPSLATVGSVSPYIGLFGTVWGIMNSFQALGNVHQATLAMVAPGISEALVATAMGLFAAIPAVIAYNRFSSRIDLLYARYNNFLEEFSAILQRQALP